MHRVVRVARRQRRVGDQVRGTPLERVPGVEDPSGGADVDQRRLKASLSGGAERRHPLEHPAEVLRDPHAVVRPSPAGQGSRSPGAKRSRRPNRHRAGADLPQESAPAEAARRFVYPCPLPIHHSSLLARLTDAQFLRRFCAS
jgi:hypothetical protein